MVLTGGGKNLDVDLLTGRSGAAAVAYTALGDNDGVAASTNTTLLHEQFRDDFDSVSYGTTNQVMCQTNVLTTEGNGVTFRECGLFTAASGGQIFNRQTFTGVAKTSSYEWRIKTFIQNQ